MRDPSVHIKLSDLARILAESLELSKKDLQALTTEIAREAKKVSVYRSIMVSTNKLERSLNTITSTTIDDATLFARTLYAIRISLKHKGVQIIKPSSKDWGIVKACADMATKFSNEFGLAKPEGFKQYLTIAISKMNKVYINKIPGMYESICNEYVAVKEIQEDTNKVVTNQIYDYFRFRVAKQTGIVNPYSKLPEKFVFFVKVRKECERLKVNYKAYIDAQFDLMAFRGVMPDPIQLIGPKALERLNKYLYANGSGSTTRT